MGSEMCIRDREKKPPEGMLFREEAFLVEKKPLRACCLEKRLFWWKQKAPAGMLFREEAFLQKN